MDENNKKNKPKTKWAKEDYKNLFVILGVLIMIITCISGCCSCLNTPNKQEQKMRKAFEKKENGEDLTPKEQETIDNYYEWKYEKDSEEQD